MAKQTINLGTAPTGAGGDTVRSALVKAQANFDELYNFNAINEAQYFSGNIDDTTAVPLGQCWVQPSTAGTKPTGVSYGLLLTLGSPGQQGRHQTFYEVSGATASTLRIFYRMNYAGSGTSTFGPWRMVYTQGNVVGTVSQTSGIPTGAIIETGSNANGTYTKFADGTMICKLYVAASNVNFSSQYGSGGWYTTTVWTFPGAFVGYPSCSGMGFLSGRILLLSLSNVPNGSSQSFFLIDPLATAPAANSTCYIQFTAMGRWY